MSRLNRNFDEQRRGIHTSGVGPTRSAGRRYGAWAVVCHRREAGLTGATVGRRGRRWQICVAELSTAVDNKLSVKVVILKNNSLAEVKFEQKEIGNPEYGCTLAPIDFVVSRRHAAPRASAANARRKVVARFRRH
jgi:hypothetical protein